MSINSNREKLFSKYALNHFVLYSLLDSEPAHEQYYSIIVPTLRVLSLTKILHLYN
jgi:hypothetical protein